MRSWPSDALLGTTRRGAYGRIALALLIFGVALWLLPARRPGEDGGHGGPGASADAFEKAGVTEIKKGLRSPGLRLRSFPGGDEVTLDGLSDHLVIVNFWATWCGPCATEMPTLEALWRRYRDRGLVVLGVSVDRGTPRALLEPYVRYHKLTFPILLDPDLAAARAWRVASLPASYIVKPGGEVAGVASGTRQWDGPEMRALLEMLLPAETRASPRIRAAGQVREERWSRRSWRRDDAVRPLAGEPPRAFRAAISPARYAWTSRQARKWGTGSERH